MDTSAINGSTGSARTSSGSAPQSAVSQSTVGGADFLSLLVTQLAYQDPLAPMDNFQFTQQLVSLASLEQLTTIAQNGGSGAGGATGDAGAMSLAQASSFIGRDATIQTNQLEVTTGTAGSVDLELDGPATSVKVELLDESGNVARTSTLGPTAAGTVSVNLDGTATGQIANGEYTIKVTALGADGKPVASTVSTHGIITAVSEKNGQIYVDVNGRTVRLDDLTRIAAAATPSTSG